MKKKRADEALYETLNLESLALARALIMEGRVMSGDRKILSASEPVKDGEKLRVRGMLDPYVSRGAHKLKKALEVFNISVSGKNCIDIGCSTGGFTDVMLRNGAKHVYCVDVGYNLLDYRLRADERVTPMERTNARYLTADNFDSQIEFGATDVSFISLKTVLPAVLPLIRGEEPAFVALIKPQFEAPKELVGEKGVVSDPEVHRSVLEDILSFIPKTGWKVTGLDYSPIRGPEGNIEFLVKLEPTGVEKELLVPPINDVIVAAYDNFSTTRK